MSPCRLSLVVALGWVVAFGGCRDRPAPATAAPEATPTPAATPIEDDSCPSSRRLRVTFGPDGLLSIQPDLGLGVGRLAWRGDLDGEPPDDLIARFPAACGNWGECPFVVLTGCGQPSTFARRWGPEYRLDLRAAPADGHGRRDLIEVLRLTSAANQDRSSATPSRRLRYIDGTYQPVDD